MGRELPGMRHLVQDQPPPEVLFGEVGVALPLLDVCLDQIQALGSHWLRAQKLGVVLAEDATAHEGEHVAEVAVDSHPSDLDEQGVGHAAGLEDRVDDATQDAQVEVDPALAIQGLERRHRRASRQSADEAQQGLLEFVGQCSISHRGGGKPPAFKAGIVKASAGGATHLIPVQEQRRAATRTHGFGHGGRRQPQQHSVHRGTSVSPHRSSQATRSRAATPPSGEHAHAKPTSKS